MHVETVAISTESVGLLLDASPNPTDGNESRLYVGYSDYGLDERHLLRFFNTNTRTFTETPVSIDSFPFDVTVGMPLVDPYINSNLYLFGSENPYGYHSVSVMQMNTDGICNEYLTVTYSQLYPNVTSAFIAGSTLWIAAAPSNSHGANRKYTIETLSLPNFKHLYGVDINLQVGPKGTVSTPNESFGNILLDVVNNHAYVHEVHFLQDRYRVTSVQRWDGPIRAWDTTDIRDGKWGYVDDITAAIHVSSDETYMFKVLQSSDGLWYLSKCELQSQQSEWIEPLSLISPSRFVFNGNCTMMFIIDARRYLRAFDVTNRHMVTSYDFGSSSELRMCHLSNDESTIFVGDENSVHGHRIHIVTDLPESLAVASTRTGRSFDGRQLSTPGII